MMHQNRYPAIIKPIFQVFFLSLAMLSYSNTYAFDLSSSVKLCNSSIGAFNKQFTTIKGLDSNNDIPVDSGLIVHTIHGPGTCPTELNLKNINKVRVDLDRTCGDYMTMKEDPVYLPWCGSNIDPEHTDQLSDTSSWTYIRHDTLTHGKNIQRPDEVVCADDNNKRYGFIFSNAYMNVKNNLGCMYPLDGDTGNRSNKGCGKSINKRINTTEAKGRCDTLETLSKYDDSFQKLLTENGGQFAPYAGSLTCSLSKPQFDLWVAARKNINLSKTAWPVNEFVLNNWDTYSTRELKNNKFVVGVYYLTGCSAASYGGNREVAQAIADLYKKWSGVDIPVVNLSNSAMRQKSTTPFSCL